MRNLIKQTFFCAAFSSILFVSCNSIGNNNTVRGDGNVIKHEVSIGVYDEIKIEGAADIVYQSKPDEAAFLEIEADDNIVPLVEVEVKGKTLNIKVKESINPSRFTIHTNSPTLKRIECKGASNIDLKGSIIGEDIKAEMKGTGNLTAENLGYKKGEFKIQGAGNMTIGGQIQKAKYEISGTGDIDAITLVATELECKLKGTGNMNVNVTDKMEIEISGTGNVSYKGNPQITKQKIKGLGSVRVL